MSLKSLWSSTLKLDFISELGVNIVSFKPNLEIASDKSKIWFAADDEVGGKLSHTKTIFFWFILFSKLSD